MTDLNEEINPEAEYWNNEGGQRWVTYIDRLEVLAGAFTDALIAKAMPQPKERVLDIGCGGGPTSAALAEAVGVEGYVLGADISELILNVARSRFDAVENLEFKTADAGVYAFDASSFDIVTSRFGVMFFPNPEAAFKNIIKALKANGRLHMVCWRGIEENPWLGTPSSAAFEILPRPERAEPGSPGPFAFSDPDHVRTILQNAGFKDIVFDKVDRDLNLGSVDGALETLCNLGPAAAALREAPEQDKALAIEALRKVVSAHETEEGVVMAGAAWLVSARA